MPPLNLEMDLELNSDVDKVFNYLVRLLRNRNITQYIENHPAAYSEVLAAVQEIPPPKPLPTPASTPREEPDPDGHDQHKNNLIDPHHQSTLAVRQDLSQGVRPLYHAYAEDEDDSGTSDNSQRSANLDAWPPSDHNHDTYDQDARQYKQPSEDTINSSIPRQLNTPQHTSSKRKQPIEDGRASKRAHIERADATEGGTGSSRAGDSTRWTYEEFALRYYMLVPSSSRTSKFGDMANNILTKVLGANKSEGLDKYQLGLTEIFIGAGMFAFLEKLRTARRNHGATVIQKTLKAQYYRRKYLKARNAALLIQRVWRGQKQRKNFHAIRNNAILLQAAAKGFLRRKAVVSIEWRWRLRRHMKSWSQQKRKVVIVQSLWRGKCARRRCEKIRQENHRNDRIAALSAHWRTQLQRIKSIGVLEDLQNFCHKIRHPVTFLDVRPDQDALQRSGGTDKIPTRDRRLKQLKFLLEDGWEKEKSLETARIVLQVSRRVHLVELTAKYMEEIEAEKAAPKKRRRQPSVKERFTDLLFPHTIKHKSKKARKGKKGRKGRDQKGQQVSEEEVRERAEKTLEYWIRLGKPLWIFSQRYGLGILAILPKELTRANLHALRKGQDQDIVDYIDLCHPGLKEQITNLSSLLPGIIASGLASKRLVVETIPSHELSDHPLEELFQFSNDGESPKLGDLPSEEPSQPSQIPTDTVDTRQADAVVGPFSDQGDANEQSSYALGTIESVQNIRSGYTSESPQSRSPSADIKDSNFTMDTQLEPSHSGGSLNPEDYYDQEDDWRAQQPLGDHGGEFLDSQDGDVQRSDPYEIEFSDLDSFINYSPQNTPSIAPISLSQSRGRNLSAHLVDLPQASTPLQSLSASTHYHDQDAGTVNPKDLLRISV